MSGGRFHIRTAQFPILPGEEREIVNPRTFGKALAQYLANQLKQRGFRIPACVAEDFGWWIEVAAPVGSSSITVRRAQDEPIGVADFAIAVSSATRKWSWRRFRYVDLMEINSQLSEDIGTILRADDAIEIVALDFESYPDDRIGPS